MTKGRNGDLSRRARRMRAGVLAATAVALFCAAPASAQVSTGDSPQSGGSSPPSPTTPPSVSGTERDGEDLTGDDGTWPLLVGTQHIWLRCSSTGSGCSQVSTSSTYTLSPADVGRTLKFRVRGTNTLTGAFREVDAATGVIDAISPINTAVPSFTGTPRDGETLSGSPGTWTGTPTIAFTYQWRRCTPACSNIAGATSINYTLGPADIGHRVLLRVTATRTENASDTGTADSAQSGVIQAIPTANVSAPQISGIVSEGEILSASPGSWTGSAPLSYSYQWERCDGACTAVGTGALYAPTAADVGKRLQVKVTASGPGGAASATSPLTAPVAARPAPGDTGTGTGTGGGTGGGTGTGTTTGTTTLPRLSPFPVIAIGGRVFRSSVLVSQLRISRAPRGAIVTVTCKGRGCPFKRMRRTIKRRSGLRIRGLERRLRNGTVIVITVRKGNTIGKYTRLRIRRGTAPARLDRCIRPGARRPSACPS